MVPRTSATGAPHPEAVEFVRFCYHRRRVGWPELYDEMCAVAGRGLFRGFSADDLGGIGVGFSLFDMPTLATLASRVVAEEAALRRPVTVVITGAEPDATDQPATAGEMAPATSMPVQIRPAPTAPTPSPVRLAATPSDERTFDIPIRLGLVPAGT
jgi:hypothetical protein